MNSGRHILSQVLDLVHWQTLARLSERFGAQSRVRHFGPRQQFACMVFAQLTWREGLRGIEACLNAKPEALYHLGFREPVAKSTLAYANEQRDWRLWQAVAMGLVAKARRLYAGEDLGLDLENTVYALDSSTIDLSMTLFPWATFRSTKSAIKIHAQIDLRGPIPVCIFVSPGSLHDVNWLDALVFEAGAIYLFDKGYIDFRRLYRISASGAFLVTRAKGNLRFSRQESRTVDKPTGVLSDHIGKLALTKARADFPLPLRRIRYFDAEQRRYLVFLTNHMELSASTVALLYKKRWNIELFFKWIKGSLRLKHYFGRKICSGVDMYYIPNEWWDGYLSADIPKLYLGASYVDWWISRAMQKVDAYENLVGYIDHETHPQSMAAGSDANPYYQKTSAPAMPGQKEIGLRLFQRPPF